MLTKFACAMLLVATAASGWQFNTYAVGGCNPNNPSWKCVDEGGAAVCCHMDDVEFGSAQLLSGGTTWTVYAYDGDSCGTLSDAGESWSGDACHAVSSRNYQTFGIIQSDAVDNPLWAYGLHE